MVASAVDSDIEKSKKMFAGDGNYFVFPFKKNETLWDKVQTFLYPQRFSFNSDFLKKMESLDPDSYDVIHIEQTWAGWAALKYTNKSLINVHYLQAIDLGLVRPKSLKERLVFKSWFRAEKKILSRYPFVRSCSERMVPYIEKWGTKEIVEAVPFGIDASLYEFIPREKRVFSKPNITIIGNMGWYPSHSAAQRLLKDIWPAVKEEIPEAELRIVGWSARQALREHVDKKDVFITENVPEIQPYFEQASVMVYPPARGSGMKIKISESLLYGVPVVTTDEGAEGLPAEDMVHMGISNDNLGLIDRTLKILRTPDLQESLRVHGRRLIQEHCSPRTTVDKIETMYGKILKFNLSK